MPRLPRPCAGSCLLALLLAAAPCSLARADGQPVLAIETGRSVGGAFTLSGREAGQQLLVTSRAADGKLRDLTRAVTSTTDPPGVVTVDATGYVTAVKEGKARIRVKAADGVETSVAVNVTNVAEDVPINFANEVVPILTRYGCNSGGCHGKSGGQNGFALSLLGFEPEEDYEHLVKEARGRRLFVAAADHSLLLRKASGAQAHGGGPRLPADTPAYRLLRRWVEQGAPHGDPLDATVDRIEVLPRERLLTKAGTQQLAVVAHYSDGSTRDVTPLAQFEANDRDMASVSDTGLVTVSGLPGTAAVMVRFQSSVNVFRATVPVGAPVGALPPAKNFIDELVFKRLKELGLPPSAPCDDATFLRRVTLDVAGRLPTLDEAKQWIADTAGDKRERLVDRLLASKDYADYFASKWSAVLRNKRQGPKEDPRPTLAFHTWIRDSLAANRPFDEFVRAVLTASGEEIKAPPVTWYREVKDAPSQVEDSAQLFLGTRLQCARCHHHPFEKWSQQDYYGLAAFFARVAYKTHPDGYVPPKGKKKGKAEPKPLVNVILKDGPATAVNPRTGQPVRPTVLGGRPLDLPAGTDPRPQLAAWITAPDNPYFARTLVNRYWKHFLGRGIVEPEDDLRTTNPATNPELLDALARHFVSSKFDLKALVRTICTSRVYQLSATPNRHNADDRQNFSRFLPRRLHAEVLFDAIDQVTLCRPQFPGAPAGTRAVQLPDNAFDSYFLTLFGRPAGASPCECERSSEVSLPQVLHLMNSLEMLAKVSGAPAKSKPAPKGKAAPKTKVVPGERAAKLAADRRPHREKLRELYLLALAREPAPDELTVLLAHLESPARTVRAAYEDVLWALMNTEEFLFNR